MNTLHEATQAIESVRDELTFIAPAICENPCLPDSSGIVQNINAEYILSWVEHQFSQGVKVVIIDPMTMINFDSRNIYADQDRFIQKMVSLSYQYQAIAVMVCHTTKKHEGKFELGDVQGSSLITKLSSCVLMIQSHENKDSTVYRVGGTVDDVEHNRSVYIAKTRCGSGIGKLAFDFGRNGANFEELGFIKPKTSR